MRYREKARKIEGLLLGWLLLGMALLAFVQVVMRYFFHSGLSWGDEVNRYLGVVLTFVGAALGVEKGSHFSMDVLYRVLPERLQPLLKKLIYLLSALIYAGVAGFGIIQVGRLYHFHSQSPALQLPMYIPYLIIPLGCTLMAWRSLCLIFRGGAGNGAGIDGDIAESGPESANTPDGQREKR